MLSHCLWFYNYRSQTSVACSTVSSKYPTSNLGMKTQTKVLFALLKLGHFIFKPYSLPLPDLSPIHEDFLFSLSPRFTWIHHSYTLLRFDDLLIRWLYSRRQWDYTKLGFHRMFQEDLHLWSRHLRRAGWKVLWHFPWDQNHQEECWLGYLPWIWSGKHCFWALTWIQYLESRNSGVARYCLKRISLPKEFHGASTRSEC